MNACVQRLCEHGFCRSSLCFRNVFIYCIYFNCLFVICLQFMFYFIFVSLGLSWIILILGEENFKSSRQFIQISKFCRFNVNLWQIQIHIINVKFIKYNNLIFSQFYYFFTLYYFGNKKSSQLAIKKHNPTNNTFFYFGILSQSFFFIVAASGPRKTGLRLRVPSIPARQSTGPGCTTAEGERYRAVGCWQVPRQAR